MSDAQRRALLSVTHKEGLPELAKGLIGFGYELIASGGTANMLREQGLPVTEVREVTGQEEILGGRVKTLHPAIAAGVLARRHEDLADTGFSAIDLVVVNLYDFASARANSSREADWVEAVDIGGPTLLRAAAKNFDRVAVVPDPGFYPELLAELAAHEGTTSAQFRRRMAAEVFGQTAAYDAEIAAGLFGNWGSRGGEALRYGENPHQPARVHVVGGRSLADVGLHPQGGKELSFNNLLDLIAALKLSHDLPENACAILKHTNPCGVGLGETVTAAYERALACDPVSAFGGIVVLSRPVDEEGAAALAERFLEVVAAPGFDEGARVILGKKKNLRWIQVDRQRFAQSTAHRVLRFGRLELQQDEDEGFPELNSFQLVSGDGADEQTRQACELAWRVCKHVKSNAIVLGDATGTLGIGAGQMSRVDSCRLALRKAADAGLDLSGAVAASDGFFPFADGVEVLAEAGIRAVIQPGGSIRDDEVAAAAQRRGVSLFLTGSRHFRH